MKKKIQIYLLFLLLCGIQPIMAQFGESRLTITDGIYNETLKATIEKNVSDFLLACNNAVMKGEKPSLSKKGTTDDARKRLAALWNTSPMSCSVSTIERSCLMARSDGYQIRQIPVIMHEAPEKDRNQEIAITLTKDGLIDDILIPVDQYMDIISSGENINNRVITGWIVDEFRTAYNRKDIQLLETFFSGNALIIVGKEVKRKKNTDSHSNTFSDRAQFEYQVRTKEEYIASLKKVFKNNKYVDVQFDSVRILQHEDFPEIYGVTLRQEWNSSTYNDNGYVFLLIDFRDELVPIIHVRTWQPEKYDGRLLRRDEIFQIGDFDINRFD